MNDEVDLSEITPGNSYACEFTITTVLNSQGTPVTAQDTPVTTGEYTSLGLIVVRDCDNQLLTVRDLTLERDFTVKWQEVSKVAAAEFKE